jgi:serine/threonine-protein kinase ATR
VLRSNQETLLSVLETLIYDPVVDWLPKKRPEKDSGGAEESANREALRTVARVSDELQGKSPGSILPLSIEGQADKLIEEARSIENLSQMYIGWAAWL